MHLHVVSILLLLTLVACGGAPGTSDPESPVGAAGPDRDEPADVDASPSPAAAIIDDHLAAYNQRDLETFMSFFHDEVEIHSFPQGTHTVGKEAASKVYGALFSAASSLEATIEQRSEHDGMVVDTEHVRFRVKGGDLQTIRALAVYQLRDGLIHRIYLIQLPG